MERREVPTGTSLFYWYTLFVRFFYIYALYNQKKDFIYIGFTENLKQRFMDHNNGFSKSTKGYIPLELIHYEAYRNRKDAKRREIYLKTNKGRTTLTIMLKEYFQKELINS